MTKKHSLLPLSLVSIFLLASSLTHNLAQADSLPYCASANFGLSYKNNTIGSDKTMAYAVLRGGCRTFFWRVQIQKDDKGTQTNLQELFMQIPLGNDDVELTFGKKIEPWDKAIIFQPLNFLQSTAWSFGLRNTSGTVSGLPLAKLKVYSEESSLTILLSDDSHRREDGVYSGLRQFAVRSTHQIGMTDMDLIYRYAQGKSRSHGLGASIDYATDEAIFYGSAYLQQGIRRQDKILARTLLQNYTDMIDEWSPQIVIGAKWYPNFLSGGELTAEYFHDGKGLTNAEWNSLGRGFAPLPYLRRNYAAILLWKSFGSSSLNVTVTHNQDDQSSLLSSNVLFRISNKTSLKLSLSNAFGENSSEFSSETIGRTALIEWRYTL